MSAIGDYLTALDTKLKTCSYITDTSNVILGQESIDLASLDSSYFPRLEVLVVKDKASGYESQRDINFSFRYMVIGYIKRSSSSVTLTDMADLMDFGVNVRALNYSFLDDMQAGSPPCNGFDMLDPYSECFYDFEFFADISVFILHMSADITLSDTEED